MSKIADCFVEIQAKGMSAFAAAMGSVKGWLEKIAQAARTFATGFGLAFKSAIDASSQLASGLAGKMGSAIGALPGLLTKAVTGLEQLGRAGRAAGLAVEGAMSRLGPSVLRGLEGIWRGGRAVGQFVEQLAAGLKSKLPTSFASADDLLSGMINGLHSGKLLKAFASLTVSVAKSSGQAFAAAGAAVAQAFVDQFGPTINKGLATIHIAWIGFKVYSQAAMTAVVATAKNVAADIGQAFAAQVGAPLVALWKKIQAGFQATGQWLVANFPKSIAELHIAWIKLASAASAAGQKIRSVMASTATAVRTLLPTAFQAAMQMAGQAIAAVAPGVAHLASTIQTSLVGALNQARAVAEAAGAAISAISLNAIPFIGGFFNSIRGGINSVVGMVASLGRSIVSVAGKLTSALTAPLRFLYNQIFSLKGLLASLGVTISAAVAGRYIAHWTADTEDANVSFKVLLGSAGQAVTMLKQLQDLADKTPLQLPEVRDAGKHLLAMGVNATAVTETIRRLGDVSQGLGLDLNHVADIYGKVSQANRMTGEDMRRFRLNGIPIARELAIMLGKSTQEIEHMAHTGKLHFGDVEKVFRKMTDEGGLFFNLMKEKGQTLGGLFSTIQDSLRNLAVYFGQGMAPAVKNIERRVIDFLDNAKDAVWPLRNQFRLMAEELAAKLPAALNFLVDAIPYVAEGIKAARTVTQALREIVAEVGREVLDWAGGANAAADGVMGLIKKVRFLAGEWRLLFEIATTRARMFAYDWHDEMVAMFGKLVNALSPFFDAIGKAIGLAIEIGFNAGLERMLRSLHRFASAHPILVSMLTGGAITGTKDDLDRIGRAAFSAGARQRDAAEEIKRMFGGFSFEPDRKKAAEEAKKLDWLLFTLNDRFREFLRQDELQKIQDMLQKRREELDQVVGTPLIDKPGLPGDADSDKKKKFAFHSLTEFSKHLQTSMKADKGVVIAKQSLEQQKKAVKLQEKTNELLKDRMVPAFA